MSRIESDATCAFNTEMWVQRARGGDEGGYNNLGWVNATGPINSMIRLADLRAGQTALDVGTGSQAIARALWENAGGNSRVFGFDISTEMLAKGLNGKEKGNIPLFVADAYEIPFPPGSVDVLTIRMVLHHIEDPAKVLLESRRLLREGVGKLVVCEYIVPDEALPFERETFDIKEPGRNLWTRTQLVELVEENWPSGEVRSYIDIMSQYSVRDWMGKSGLPQRTQNLVLEHYLDAPEDVQQAMRITYTGDDALVDRPFVFVVAKK